MVLNALKTSPDISIVNNLSRRDFLDALFGEYFEGHDGFIEVQAIVNFRRKPHIRFFPNIDTLAKEHFPEHQEVFLGICPREKMKAGSDDVRHITALWATLDIAGGGHSGKDAFQNCQRAARAVRHFPLVPSMIVESGRGLHLYWLLDQPMQIVDAAKIEEGLKKIGLFFKCKKEAKIHTMLRLPGTFNNEILHLRTVCKIKYINSEFRYTPEDIARCLAKLKRLGIRVT